MNEELKKRYYEIKKEIWNAQTGYRKSLKPCPFCGDTPTIGTYYSIGEDGEIYWYNKIQCSNCGCQMEDKRHISEDVMGVELGADYIVEKWNMRVKLKDE